MFPYLDCRFWLHEMCHRDVSVHVCLPVEDLVTVRTDVLGETAGYVYSR